MESETTPSAVAPPVSERGQSVEGNGLKRRQSDEGEQDMKRQRISPGKNSPNATEDAEHAGTGVAEDETHSSSKPSNAEQAPDTRDSRRKSSTADEKQRSKRLFGALLGNLNQPNDRMSKRRAEIEQRRKAELQKQDDEHTENRLKRLEQLKEHRRRVQEELDEDNMHLRHKGMLHMANFLRTAEAPHVLYLPYELLPHQEDIIEDQIRAVKSQVDAEVAEFERRKLQRSGQNTVVEESVVGRPSESDATDGEVPKISAGDTEMSSNTIDVDQQISSDAARDGPINTDVEDAALPSSNTDGSTSREAATVPPDNRNGGAETNADAVESEDDGDHVVEGDEDTVIY